MSEVAIFRQLTWSEVLAWLFGPTPTLIHCLNESACKILVFAGSRKGESFGKTVALGASRHSHSLTWAKFDQ
jgi:hypothetical protein